MVVTRRGDARSAARGAESLARVGLGAPAAALITLLLTACEATDPPVRTPVPFARADDLAASNVRGGDNGLEAVQWNAPCDAAHAARTLEAHGRGGTLPPETHERLRRNGFAVAEVPIDALPATLADLGGTLSDIRNWHGQVPEWRELLRTNVGSGVAIFTGDRVVPVDGGSIRLSMRGWTVPMEDGGLFWLEMIPHAVTRESAAATAIAPRDRVRGDAFPDAGFSVVLDKGWALLLCPEPVAANPEGSLRPETEPPVTLGSLLLPCENLPVVGEGILQQRTPVIVLIARLPDALVPPIDPSAPDGAASGTDDDGAATSSATSAHGSASVSGGRS